MDPNTEKEILARLDRVTRELRFLRRLLCGLVMSGLVFGSWYVSGELALVMTIGCISLSISYLIADSFFGMRKRKKEQEFRFRELSGR
jgi:hypothetical protein